jgi:hypothetical protein
MSVNKTTASGMLANHQSIPKLHGVRNLIHQLLDSGAKLHAHMNAHHHHQLSSPKSSATHQRCSMAKTLDFGTHAQR